MYPKPLDPAPAPVAWGCLYEGVAIQCYVSHMEKLGKASISVQNCGFVVHPEKGWLGASPDGKVKDLSSKQPDGIIEVKCPYSKHEVTPEEACNDPNFSCELVDSEVQLKLTHAYYHHVQLQLYVGADLYHWCDFCIYTCKGLSVQRIHQNSTWQERCIPKLESFYDECILPELLLGKYKPRYIL